MLMELEGSMDFTDFELLSVMKSRLMSSILMGFTRDRLLLLFLNVDRVSGILRGWC